MKAELVYTRGLARAIVVIAMLVIALAACSDGGSTGPKDGGFQPVVGSFCTVAQHQSGGAVYASGEWRVTLFIDTTRYRVVVGDDGIVRQQEVRSCTERRCTFSDPNQQMTGGQAVQQCGGTAP